MTSVLHVITGLGLGGAERALHTLLTGGLATRFDCRVISLTDEGHYGPLLRAAGVPVDALGLAPGRPTPAAAIRLMRAVRAAAPDIVQGWMYHGDLAATLGRRLAAPGAALAWNIRMSLETGRRMKASTRAVIRVGAWLSGGPDAIIYNAARAREEHEQDGYAAARGVIAPNGFDAERWRPDPSARARLIAELGLPEHAVLIGFVGRGHAHKDPANLFAAFSATARTHPDARLLCVGEGLRDFPGAGADPKRVVFLGRRFDVERLMPGFDLLCLSSAVEGFPNVIGEAMACGTPCVTTDVGDAATIVGDTGWVAPPGDPAALGAALSRAMTASTQERRARGWAARARIQACYSLDAVVDQYQALYRRLTGGR